MTRTQESCTGQQRAGRSMLGNQASLFILRVRGEGVNHLSLSMYGYAVAQKTQYESSREMHAKRRRKTKTH